MTFGTRRRVALGIAVAALIFVTPALALSGTTALDVTASGQASGDATDACLAYDLLLDLFRHRCRRPIRSADADHVIDGGLQLDSIKGAR